MTAARRLRKEFEDYRTSGIKSFRDVEVDESNVLLWRGLIVPDNPPYNSGAFRIEIYYPIEYPFKPPKINFITKIYHPNIDENGKVCLSLIKAGKWKATSRTSFVIPALMTLLDNPQPKYPMRPTLIEEYLKDRMKFMKNAEEFTKKYSETRPSN